MAAKRRQRVNGPLQVSPESDYGCRKPRPFDELKAEMGMPQGRGVSTEPGSMRAARAQGGARNLGGPATSASSKAEAEDEGEPKSPRVQGVRWRE